MMIIKYLSPSPVIFHLCELIGVGRTGFVLAQCREQGLILTIEGAELLSLIVAVGLRSGVHGARSLLGRDGGASWLVPLCDTYCDRIILHIIFVP